MVKTNKILVCGYKGIGKTTFLETLLYGNFGSQDIHPTIEDIYVGTVESERGTTEILRFYDTQGLSSIEPKELNLIRPYYGILDGFILVYGTYSRVSFDLIDGIKKDIDKHKEKREIPIVAIGINWSQTSSSLTKKREVDPSFVIGWATREKFRHFEIDLDHRKSLIPPVSYLATKLIPPPQKPAFSAQLGGLVSGNKLSSSMSLSSSNKQQHQLKES